MDEAFVPLSSAPRECFSYEQRWDWLSRHVHATLGFVRGTTHCIWDEVQKGWHVRGERKTPPSARGPGGRFRKKGDG